ncbi:MAG TPA: SH3 domain-containing protein [Pyrinomonadaceae bacterium]
MKILKNRKIFLTFFLLICGVSGALSQERKVLPADEGKTDASFRAFREKTLEAARRRDVKYILSIVDANIQNTFGDSNGVAEFKKMWKLSSPQSEFWDEFITVLTNGGAFFKRAGAPKKQIFQAPYTFTEFPEDLDAIEHQTIFGNNVNLRSKPEKSAPVVASLSYNIVKVDFENSVKHESKEGKYLWLKVETLGGKKGFVDARYVRSPVDYRAVFEKRNGSWKLVTFIAGD